MTDVFINLKNWHFIIFFKKTSGFWLEEILQLLHFIVKKKISIIIAYFTWDFLTGDKEQINHSHMRVISYNRIY